MVTADNVAQLRYRIVGDAMHVHFQIENTSISGPPTNAVVFRIPEGRRTRWNQNALLMIGDSSVPRLGYIETGPGNFVIALVTWPGETYTPTSGAGNSVTSFYGEITLELLPLLP